MIALRTLAPAVSDATATLLDVRHLSVQFPASGGPFRAVNDVSFSLTGGRVLAILGESGSGKSMLLRSILGIQPHTASVDGAALFRGVDLLTLSAKEREQVRGASLSMVFQNPMTALDPVFTVEKQIVETLRRHTDMRHDAARARALELLRLVQIPSPEHRLKAYPFELSGGMQQRVVIAMALACNPSVLLADEPTTALDVTVQARVLELLASLQRQLGMSVIIVTHDVAVAAAIADDVIVMYAGRVIERGPIATVLRAPHHPYTRGLLAANVRPGQRTRPVAIPGAPPNLSRLPQGCAFAPRCGSAIDACRHTMPALQRAGSAHESRCVLAAENVA